MLNTNTVVGVFDTHQEAQGAVDELLNNGFDRKDVQIKAATASSADDDSDDSREDGIGGFFRSLFGSDDSSRETGVYDEAMRRGSTMVTVNADNDEMLDCAVETLEEYGAVDIDERAIQWTGEGWNNPDRRSELSDASAAPMRATNEDNDVLEVTEEELQVGKREVERGRVRVYSRVTETPVEEDVSLREEHINIERRPVNRPIHAGDTAFQERTIELTETAEEPVIGKTARVVEEVIIGKDVTERTETVRDTLRRTDVEVDKSSH